MPSTFYFIAPGISTSRCWSFCSSVWILLCTHSPKNFSFGNTKCIFSLLYTSSCIISLFSGNKPLFPISRSNSQSVFYWGFPAPHPKLAARAKRGKMSKGCRVGRSWILHSLRWGKGVVPQAKSLTCCLCLHSGLLAFLKSACFSCELLEEPKEENIWAMGEIWLEEKKMGLGELTLFQPQKQNNFWVNILSTYFSQRCLLVVNISVVSTSI